VINFVAVTPAGAGDLRVTPYATAMPLASFLNYAAVSGLNIANGLAVATCNPATSPAIDFATVPAMVSIDWSSSSGTDLMVFVRSSGAACAAGELNIATYRFGSTPTAPTLYDGVAFHVFVP
jgi:hypothetical protein